MRIAHCSSCGEPIVWAEMPSGNMCPFDAEMTPTGRWAIDDRSNPPCAAKIERTEGSSEMGFTSHFATCAFADTHRRKR